MKPGQAALPLERRDETQREADRLNALDRLDILDTPREERFDRITRLIRNALGVDIAIVSLIDAHRQWYKSIDGLEAQQVSLRDSFCRYAMEQSEPMIVADAREDERFADHPMVLGTPNIRFYASVPLKSPDGYKLGTVCVIDPAPRTFTPREVSILTDLAQIAVDEMELRALATTDGLTGLSSRRAFKEEAARAIALAARYRNELACIVFDLDHFKVVNDSYGHAAGDRVLQAVAAACSRILRQSDVVGRIGGEEFAVALPHTGAQDAALVAEKLRAEIEAQRFDFGKVNINVTASLGLARLDFEKPDLDGLLAEADAALYEAKSSGRNRVVVRRNAQEIRRGVRRRVLKAGRILLNNRFSTIDCTVRSLSDDGAGIDVASLGGIPERFILAIPSDRFEGQCRVVTQTERHLEVEFC